MLYYGRRWTQLETDMISRSKHKSMQLRSVNIKQCCL